MAKPRKAQPGKAARKSKTAGPRSAGRAAGKRLVPRIRKISDPEQLHALFEAILKADSLGEVRQPRPLPGQRAPLDLRR